ncbi:NAD-dependent epimerase/dehydratase family protein [Streptomyces beihaiensis]|uniref:NAD-dependent epimerase/dehydratase family protein n=1 Tax=Streptomyces beihaiensis TaxID=2984495 RepID=A0ABT3TNE4_9ACTN|nr:NAD-dependent epimerase/dehydratase family protein [Streptomyces beihaiensis]MCX3058564.1 NAD-dependent epimerase/dehydratase family protein [Streptomyces beihaiensis]
MRILLIGGTWFLGKAIARTALSAGHHVTTFNRGRSAPDLAGVTAVHGDRTDIDDLNRLALHGPWDMAIDTSASEMAPRQVLSGARALEPVTDRYVYVSTVNAYRGWPNEPLTEASPVYDAPPDADRDYGADEGGPAHYGKQKAGCEGAASAEFGERLTILRPGVILGPGEYVGRLPWWLNRCARGGSILAPGAPDKLIQPIDVRDVAAFALAAPAGAFNLAGPRGRDRMVDFLTACLSATGSSGRLVFASDAALVAHRVKQWTELPLWRTNPGTWAVDTAKAQASGLTCRPLADTVADTWTWMQSDDAPVKHPRWEEHGIDPAREGQILAGL